VNATFSRNKVRDFVEFVDDWDNGGQQSLDLGTTNLAFSPNVVSNSNLSWILFRNMELRLLSSYVGKQFIDNSSSNDRMLDAWFVNNLNFTYSVHLAFLKEVRFHLQINNLFNEEYESNAWVYSYILGGERYKMDGYFPQAGTHFMAGIDFRF
jgi:iron complex outermembrane receptor protein